MRAVRAHSGPKEETIVHLSTHPHQSGPHVHPILSLTKPFSRRPPIQRLFRSRPRRIGPLFNPTRSSLRSSSPVVLPPLLNFLGSPFDTIRYTTARSRLEE
eukprot:9754991-Alexandrium_andersonii.AAC.1